MVTIDKNTTNNGTAQNKKNTLETYTKKKQANPSFIKGVFDGMLRQIKLQFIKCIVWIGIIIAVIVSGVLLILFPRFIFACTIEITNLLITRYSRPSFLTDKATD